MKTFLIILLSVLTFKATLNYFSYPPQRKPSIVHVEEQDGFFNAWGFDRRVRNSYRRAVVKLYGSEGRYQEQQMNSAEKKKYVKKG